MSQFNKNTVIYSVEDLQKLVLRAKDGDKESFSKLYQAYFNPIYRYVYSRTHNKDKTDDVVQVVFIKWYNSIQSYNLQTSPLQYLFVIARRVLFDLKDESIVSSLDDENAKYVDLKDETAPQDEIIDIRITTAQVVEQMKSLSDLHREVINLHFFAELSTEEIASILNKKESAVRQIKHRALVALRDLTKKFNEKS
jgi:RNA polymerase sigma-70 factor (ECF subfamily)